MNANLKNNFKNRTGDDFLGGPPKFPKFWGKEKSAGPVLNKIDFYGRDFFVDKNVLIPRPESEMIIDAVLNLAGKSYLLGVKPSKRKLPKNPNILDIGTGSGCLAITLKLELENANISAVDISKKALKIAKKNARNLGATIYPLIISDLLENVNFTPDSTPDSAPDSTPNSTPKKSTTNRTSFPLPDVIIANLPYVDKNWDWLDLKTLSKEPEIALFAEDGGLFLIKKLLCEISEKLKNLKKPLYIVLEADPSQHPKLIKYALNLNLEHIETRGFILTFKLRSK